MTYKADPGGQFESDAHRRVCGLIPVPEDEPQKMIHIWARCQFDDHNQIADEFALTEVVKDLIDAGFVEKVEGGVRQTAAGLEALNAPAEGEK